MGKWIVLGAVGLAAVFAIIVMANLNKYKKK